MNLGWVIRMFMAAGVTVCHAAVAATQDEVIPPAVAGPYLAYEQAVAAQDAAAARAAALQAFAAAQAAGLSDTIMLTLGVNAVAAAEQAGDWRDVAEVALVAAEIARWQGAGGDEQALLERAVTAARLSLDYVTLIPARRLLLARLFDAGNARHADLLRAGQVDAPSLGVRVSPTPASPDNDSLRGMADAALSRGSSGARDYVNAQVGLLEHAIAEEDWQEALAVVREASAIVGAMDGVGEAEAAGLYDALLERVSLILWRGYQDRGSGRSYFSGSAEQAWCAYLFRRPQVLEWGPPLYPPRALERGHWSGLVRLRFRVMPEGGRARLDEAESAGRPSRIEYRTASERNLVGLVFRPQCRLDGAPVEMTEWDGFVISEFESRGRGARVGAYVFSSMAGFGQD
ncbi:MAG: hypothetical protein KIS81_10695 [Maricaulaceae bacterium]|nr:hypothetical protein [Maricaulaceae bacterium]